ncbi:MAG: ABC transporter substrate-binding protein [Rhodospirillaceae bacterium]|nr:ABC transporter substrate-binding protein [Rhodospirillaceae bacterium]
MRTLIASVIAAIFFVSAAMSNAQTLRVAVSAYPPTLGNPFTGVSQPSAELWWSIYDGLTRFNWTGGPAPALALSWENTSPTTWVFKLRPGVTYHSGKPFTAQDVVDVLALMKRKDMSRYLIPNELSLVSGSRALDDLTVEIKTTEPDAILPKRLSTLMMVDPELWNKIGADGYTLAPVGTGPFKLSTFGRGNAAAVLDANPTSWRASKNVQRVEYKLVADKTSRIQALLSGQVDLVTGLHVDDVTVVEGRGFGVIVQPNHQVKSIALPNVLREDPYPLNDARVRRALNYAVDKESIAKFIMFGYADVVSQGVTQNTIGYNPDLKPFSYDPERARALLVEAGYPDGFTMKIEVVTDSTTPDGLMYQRVAQDLEAIGIDVTLRAIPYSEYSRKYALSEWGDADGFHLVWNNAAFQDPIRPIEYFSCMRANPFFCVPEMIDTIKQSNAEMNPEKRILLLQNIMAEYHELAPAIWLTNAVYTTAYSDRVVSFDYRPTGTVFETLIMKDD